MGCGCAGRMREIVLPRTGYTLKNGQWTHPTREPIPDTEVESSHSRLTLEILQMEGRDRAAKLREKLSGKI